MFKPGNLLYFKALEIDNTLDDKFATNLINYLRALKEKGKIVYVKHDDQNIYTFWGSPSWLGSDRKPLPQFMYDLKGLNLNNNKQMTIEEITI